MDRVARLCAHFPAPSAGNEVKYWLALLLRPLCLHLRFRISSESEQVALLCSASDCSTESCSQAIQREPCSAATGTARFKVAVLGEAYIKLDCVWFSAGIVSLQPTTVRTRRHLQEDHGLNQSAHNRKYRESKD